MLLVSNLYNQGIANILNTPNVQAVGLSIIRNKEEFRVVCVYGGTSVGTAEDAEILQFLRDQIKKNGKLLLMGDFNVPEVKWGTETAPQNSFGAALLRHLHDYALIQHVDEQTRWQEGQPPSLLDPVITRYPDDICKMVIEAPLGKSDHGWISFELELRTVDVPCKLRRAYGEINTTQLRTQAIQINRDLSTVGDSVDSKWRYIK